MRLADMLGLALSALYQQKARTALTLSGVVIGTFILAVNLSLGRGTQDEILRQLRRGQELRQVLVWPRSEARASDIPPEELRVEGDMSDAKQARIRAAIIRRWQSRGGPPRRTVLLTPERLRSLSELPHVESVLPPREPCRVVMDDHSRDVLGLAATADNEPYRERIVAGSYLPADDDHSAVVGEYLLYVWGIRSDEAVQAVVGRKLRVECHGGGAAPLAVLTLLGANQLELTPEENRAVEKALKRLPAVVDRLGLTAQDVLALKKLFDRLAPGSSPAGTEPVAEEFTITGVFRELTEEELKQSTPLGWGANTVSRNVDVWLPVKTGQDLFLRQPQNAKNGFPAVILTVDGEEHVKEVTQRIRDMELEEFAPLNFIEQVQTNMILTTLLAGLLAAAALLVSVLGITNTMIMSVLERTREIGIMKAVGARDRHIQALFLVEGAFLGVLGGSAGVLLSWLVSFPGDAVARSVVKASTELTLTGRLFVFPLWLTLGLPLFAGVVTTLAALYPARRAARVNPITALRHE